MKTTPFTEKHISLGAKMHEFAGYNMPIEYSGIIDEHLTVCQGVGVFDVSHMGEFCRDKSKQSLTEAIGLSLPGNGTILANFVGNFI